MVLQLHLHQWQHKNLYGHTHAFCDKERNTNNSREDQTIYKYDVIDVHDRPGYSVHILLAKTRSCSTLLDVNCVEYCTKNI